MTALNDATRHAGACEHCSARSPLLTSAARPNNAARSTAQPLAALVARRERPLDGRAASSAQRVANDARRRAPRRCS